MIKFVLFWLITQVSCMQGLYRGPQIPFPSAIPTRTLTAQQNDVPLIQQCQELWRTADIDNFAFLAEAPLCGSTTFQQRYFVCSEYWESQDSPDASAPVFFYAGNEADVTLYLNNTGLMWEQAPHFKALLVFAEHRYYGKSIPCDSGHDFNPSKLSYLSSQQAMADYVQLIDEIQKQYGGGVKHPVIAFGGSYGGMLAAWMRMKYPHAVQGSIAASAPIINYMGEWPEFDPYCYGRVVTDDAREVGGSAPRCADNVRNAWSTLLKMGRSNEVFWASNPWSYYAMGSFPYPSSYMLSGTADLPPFPTRVACEYLKDDGMSEEELLQGMHSAISLWYNATGTTTCFDWMAGPSEENERVSALWGYQWCTEQFMPFAYDGVGDMFWEDPWLPENEVQMCLRRMNVHTRPLKMSLEFGGRNITSASNIVFSNGSLDPWKCGGVLEDIGDSIHALMIEEGGHHVDLMWSHPMDTPQITAARQFEVDKMHEWIQQYVGQLDIVQQSEKIVEA